MDRVYIGQVKNNVGKVLLQGFVDNLRDGKHMCFIILRDITGKVQITIDKAEHPELTDVIAPLTTDCVISVTGQVEENEFVA